MSRPSAIAVLFTVVVGAGAYFAGGVPVLEEIFAIVEANEAVQNGPIDFGSFSDTMRTIAFIGVPLMVLGGYLFWYLKYVVRSEAARARRGRR
jgi:hypothetical protein